MVRIVASCGRRRRLVEEVPGLYIRRLTLEDPKSAKESADGSRSRTPPAHPSSHSPPKRHICHPPGSYVSSSTSSSYIRAGSSSYRSWQERIRKERPAYLTIVSLELPESPIPLIESQASARFRSNEFDANRDKDDILDELLEKVSEIGRERERERASSRSGKYDGFARERRTRKRQLGSMECTKEVATLEECTRNILETHQIAGEEIERASERNFRDVEDCICSEIPENLRINVRKKTEVTSATSSSSSSPEVTHTIRIAMKYQGRPGRCKITGGGGERGERAGEVDKNEGRKGRGPKGRTGKDPRETTESTKTTNSGFGRGEEVIREEGCCTGVNVALDFTVNCSSVRLTSRDISLKAGTKGER